MYIYPDKAKVDTVITKTKLFTKAKFPASLRRKYENWVDLFNWSYILAPHTIGFAPSDGYQQIQIFDINVRYDEKIEFDVLSRIDKSMKFPIIYRLFAKDKTTTVISYKRPALDGTDNWVLGEYFQSGWTKQKPAKNIPFATNIKTLYEQIMLQFLPINPANDESLEQLSQRWRQIRQTQNQIEKLQAKMIAQKQFNRKFETNAALRQLKEHLCELEQG